MKAIWKDVVIAESADTVVVEGNHYFPPASVRSDFLRPSDTQTSCPWKGVASYYDIVVHDAVNKDAAWHYPATKDAAKQIQGHVAFWRGVDVTD